MDTLSIITTLILFLNVTLLTILVPGWPIENRDFSHLKWIVFWWFNVFLISLWIATLVMCYYVLLWNIWAFKVSIVLGILYFIVYMIDLWKIFPKSPTDMSKTLMLLEIVNSMFALLLIIFCLAKLNIL